jgi:DNA-binding response OmpR family regulator
MSIPKILIVEDDIELIEIYEIIFTQEDFEVKIAYDGKQGLAMLRSFRPDVILLDIMMPEMDGFEFIKKVRADKNPVKIVVNSNLSQDDEIKKAMELGANKYLCKSDNDPHQLVAKIDEFLLQNNFVRPTKPQLTEIEQLLDEMD